MTKYKLEKLKLTTDGKKFKIAVLDLGVRKLIQTYPDLFSVQRAGFYRVSLPYREGGVTYVDVPIIEERTAIEVIKYCGDPKFVDFI